jgi:hypothetical protein
MASASIRPPKSESMPQVSTIKARQGIPIQPRRNPL